MSAVTVVRKMLLMAGAVGALIAAEGLNRFASLVRAFGGKDEPFYMVFLVISVIAVGVLSLALFGKANRVVKWVLAIGLGAVVILLLLQAPAFPVIGQVLIGLAIATVGTLSISVAPK